MKQKFYVLLGDVISSSKIQNREEARKKLARACNEVNNVYAKDIRADFKILKGIDEIGGVLSTMRNIYNIITTILWQLYPNLIRFVLVFDYIDTAIDTGDIAKMDGSAFHKASNMMPLLKKSKLMFDMRVGDKMIDNSITGQVNLILLLKKNWSAHQNRIVREYEKTKNQYEVAKKLGTTQQSVSNTLNRSMWKEIKSIEEKLNDMLEEYTQKIEGG